MKHHVSKSSEEILERRILLLSFFPELLLSLPNCFMQFTVIHNLLLWMLYTMLLS